jgi:hypothetical protein
MVQDRHSNPKRWARLFRGAGVVEAICKASWRINWHLYGDNPFSSFTHAEQTLFFIDAFRDLVRFPIVFNGMILVSIAGFPGKTIGELVGSCLFALSGACVGLASRGR